MSRHLLPSLALALALPCCAAPREGALPLSAGLPATLVLDEGGPWAEVASTEVAGRDGVAPTRPPPHEGPPSREALPSATAPIPAPTEPALAVPARRATREPAPRGTPPDKSPRRLARERHLDHPTRIVAERVTFVCPAAYAHEIRLTGRSVSDPAPGRRIAEGAARLLCRELTLEAEHLVLKIADQPDADLQVLARGGVSFVSLQRGQAFREEGCRSLVLTNDRIVPLR